MSKYTVCRTRWVLWLVLLVAGALPLAAQSAKTKSAAKTSCPIAFDEYDPFDSLRTVGTEEVNLGYLMTTLYEEVDGPRTVPECKALFVSAENDSIRAIFLTLVLPEYGYEAVASDFNVKLKLANDTVVVLYTIPDEGYFDKKTNMRHYQHTALLPMDTYYLLTAYAIELIRVEYPKHRRTIEVLPKQQARLQELARCLGERLGFYPLTP